LILCLGRDGSAARNRTGHFVTFNVLAAKQSRVLRILATGAMLLVLAGCSGFNLFGPTKIKEEAIIPPQTLYQQALGEIENQRYMTSIKTLEKLERQHPYSDFAEKAKLMTVYAHFRNQKYGETVLAADRYLALYPTSKEVPYVLYLKGSAYFEQIKDITRDQEISTNAIDTFQLITVNYPDSEYAKDARDKLVISADQLAGKEMSVGRFYLGTGQYGAAINRFRVVVERYQTSTHIEEALFRLTEANLALGLIGEAQTAAAVLGLNYPASTWYKEAFELLQKQGIEPKVADGSPLATVIKQG
jgi:outer membrane protein assembly factor BamD